MYQPPHFRQTEIDTLHAFIRQHPLGLLISSGTAGLLANPVPFFLKSEPDGKTSLIAHLARANPQWQALEKDVEALVVFMGPDHYISPGWYRTKQETGKVVPTWNYQLVQVRGHVRVHHDSDWLRHQVKLLTDQQEADHPRPWALEDAPEPYVAGQLKGIVGIEINVTLIEGKLKASQNRNEADRDGVRNGLLEKDTGSASIMAALVPK
ncbi:FMN-binding negative transcriptional regulator [Allorhizobium sp. BGMRC 0089]|uniref:FMN-binding negative transcriptional regulator n=1 Tax=Allorhizobium sonneratiae TaxID=2934936 RepID=UPI0020338D66|nr:FMN-binding negative transcriptional regulator [Allorhizobium sonneratiae]MCM2290904.1 FMN-binding negative transcriptional regulator [Allorhizobium sonneratiae]